VPEYGNRIASPVKVAVPFITTSQTGTPGPVAPAVTEIGIVVAPGSFSSPQADPETARLPGQRAKNSPEISVAVWLVTRHSKLLQALDPDAAALDVQVPR